MAPLFDPSAFATEVRVLMARKHITMREAAVEIGCAIATVSRICNGKHPDVENYLRIKKWLADATNNPVPLTLSDAGSDAEGRG